MNWGNFLDRILSDIKRRPNIFGLFNLLTKFGRPIPVISDDLPQHFNLISCQLSLKWDGYVVYWNLRDRDISWHKTKPRSKREVSGSTACPRSQATDTSFAACQDKSWPWYVIYRVSGDAMALAPYGTDTSINLHFRLKHKGNTK